MQNATYNQIGKVNPAALASGLIKVAGSVYILLGASELVNVFFRERIDIFGVIVYLALGICLLRGYAWARVLCITVSGMAAAAGLLMLVFRNQAALGVSLNGAPLVSGTAFILGTLIVHAFLLFVLLRRDVSGLLPTRGK
jgi:hypothetical protein